VSCREGFGVQVSSCLQKVGEVQHGALASNRVVAKVQHLEVVVELDGLAKETASLVPEVIALHRQGGSRCSEEACSWGHEFAFIEKG
jgi:hypothetical protein